jgi:hypothetical protein
VLSVRCRHDAGRIAGADVKGPAVVAVALAAAAAGWAGGRYLPSPDASSAYVAPRTPFGQPDLQGVWQARNTANWNLEHSPGGWNMPAGFGVVVDPADGNIPYRPEALERRRQNFASREQADPLQKCYLAGVPRTMYLPHPMQIFQTAEEFVILSEYVHTWRWIPLVPLDRYPGYESWMGDPRGRWEGGTLVVETTGFNGETWLDHAGNFHSAELKVVERFARTAPDVITYEATIDDPKVFTRSWTIRMPLERRTDRSQILEYECYLYAEDAGRPVIGSHPEVK